MMILVKPEKMPKRRKKQHETPNQSLVFFAEWEYNGNRYEQETDFGKSISERTGMDMGITDVTAGGAKPIRVEMPQVSSPAPQRVPKTEVKMPPKASAPSPAPQAVTPSGAGAATANVSVTPSVMASDVMQPKVQTGTAVRTGKDADVSGERVSRPQGTNRINRMPAQDGQRVSRQQEEKKEPTEQDSYYEKVMAEKAMENAEERLRSLRHNVRFGYNDDIERYTITITEADDQKVVKEIPSEEIQKMIEHLHTMRGMMFETEV